MVIYIGDGHRLRRYDKRNWVLEEHREPNRRNGKSRSTEPRWFSCDRYFQTVAAGLSWVYEHEALDDPLEAGLKGALDRAQEIADSLVLRAARYEEGAGDGE